MRVFAVIRLIYIGVQSLQITIKALGHLIAGRNIEGFESENWRGSKRIKMDWRGSKRIEKDQRGKKRIQED